MRIFISLIFCFFTFFAFGQRREKTLFQDYALKSKKWTKQHGTEKESILKVLDSIKKSATGQKLIAAAEKRAEELGGKLIDFISAGSKSYTDTTLVRRFKPHHPDEVEYKTKSVVYLDNDLGQVEAILDLSHELTHFTYREPFNPYNEKFKAAGFIASTIEGRGGEVDAYLMECRILDELFSVKVKGRFQCTQIKDPDTGQLSRKWAVKRFYQMGHYAKDFKSKIIKHGIQETEIQEISKDQALFYSSAYGVPYPVAALEEFEWVKGKVCRNDEKRIELISKNFDAQNSGIKRTLANLKSSYLKRCSETIL
jgi:hypothetical protein